MLTFFQMRSTFYKLTVRLTVDLDAKEAEVTVSYEGRIQRIEAVNLWEVDTPEKAHTWLSRPMGERGNFVERLEWMARSGILRQEAPKAAPSAEFCGLTADGLAVFKTSEHCGI